MLFLKLKKPPQTLGNRFLSQSVRREKGRAKSRQGKEGRASIRELGLGPIDKDKKMAIVSDTGWRVLS